MVMLLRAFVGSIIREGRIDDAKAKHPALAAGIDRALRDLGPQGVSSLDWVVRQLRRREPADEVGDALVAFRAAKGRLPNADINSYRTLADLRDALAAARARGPSRAGAGRAAREGANIILRRGDILVIEPTTEAASCLYGKGTRWCISATRTRNYFDSYRQRSDRFFFIIDRSRAPDDPLAKAALVTMHKPPGEGGEDGADVPAWFQFFDAQDRKLSPSTAVRELGPLLDELLSMAYGPRWGAQQKGRLAVMTSDDVPTLVRMLMQSRRSPYEVEPDDDIARGMTSDILKNPHMTPEVKAGLLERDPDAIHDFIVTGAGDADDWSVAWAIERAARDGKDSVAASAVDGWLYEKGEFDQAPIGPLAFEAALQHDPNLLAGLLSAAQLTPDVYLTREQTVRALRDPAVRQRTGELLFIDVDPADRPNPDFWRRVMDRWHALLVDVGVE